MCGQLAIADHGYDRGVAEYDQRWNGFVSRRTATWRSFTERLPLSVFSLATAALLGIGVLLLCAMYSLPSIFQMAAWLLGMIATTLSGMALLFTRQKRFLIPLFLGCLIWLVAEGIRRGFSVW